MLAVAAQLGVHITNKLDVVNFFSFFTNLSNIFAYVVLLVGAVYLALRRDPTPLEDNIRGTATVCMAIVGIVFSLLLRNEDLGSLLPWVNAVVHFIMPVVVVADWILVPPKSRITPRQVVFWLIFPLLYLVYTLTRGAITHWYPYPFLNPDKVGGAGGVAGYCIAIFVGFLVFGVLFMYIGNRLTRRI